MVDKMINQRQVQHSIIILKNIALFLLLFPFIFHQLLLNLVKIKVNLQRFHQKHHSFQILISEFRPIIHHIRLLLIPTALIDVQNLLGNERLFINIKHLSNTISDIKSLNIPNLLVKFSQKQVNSDLFLRQIHNNLIHMVFRILPIKLELDIHILYVLEE